MTETKYYSVTEFAAILNVDPQTIYRWIRTGKINAIQARRWTALRIPSTELERMSTQQRSS